MKKLLHCALAAGLFISLCPLAACNNASNHTGRDKNVLRIASWDEYIDEGGEDSYVPGSLPMYEEFEQWYKDVYNETITVEYVTLQDNETMYNKMKMGDTYDLLCPSEYMIMKLAAEGFIQKYPTEFFDKSNPLNYYAQNVSPYIQNVFDSGTLKDGSKWSEYTAGYMWGSTGFVFNPANIHPDINQARAIMSSWDCLASPACTRKITMKDNVRDSYFAGLGMYYEDELLALQAKLDSGEITLAEYKSLLSTKMNDTSVEVMNATKKKLEVARGNLYGLETDEGKSDVIAGRLDASYQWSGDAVFIIDEAENSDTPLILEYSIPKAASNLWFDGRVMTKDANVKAATAFVNFVSQPINVIRNMYYIGYTSCIAGDDVFAYAEEMYSAEDGNENAIEYDVSYFFGEDYIITAPEDQCKSLGLLLRVLAVIEIDLFLFKRGINGHFFANQLLVCRRQIFHRRRSRRQNSRVRSKIAVIDLRKKRKERCGVGDVGRGSRFGGRCCRCCFGSRCCRCCCFGSGRHAWFTRTRRCPVTGTK